ncbi:hypothetical protein PAMC26510_26810 [Caballeronia sordidicola]|uniref:Uncharacterized protein n=1 Tax=Caballeronia sordidicola TaxID=196367 RepID=A0A242MED0_CABSO|nr:hypothetical protein PAMC26510_26810 [Caballeronia sordidicola]
MRQAAKGHVVETRNARGRLGKDCSGHWSSLYEIECGNINDFYPSGTRKTVRLARHVVSCSTW